MSHKSKSTPSNYKHSSVGSGMASISIFLLFSSGAPYWRMFNIMVIERRSCSRKPDLMFLWGNLKSIDKLRIVSNLLALNIQQPTVLYIKIWTQDIDTWNSLLLFMPFCPLFFILKIHLLFYWLVCFKNHSVIISVMLEMFYHSVIISVMHGIY